MQPNSILNVSAPHVDHGTEYEKNASNHHGGMHQDGHPHRPEPFHLGGE